MKCAKVCNDCQLQCDSCFKHCLTLLDDGKKEYAKLAQLCADCAECCKTCSTLCARQSPLTRPMLECCAKCCDECARGLREDPGQQAHYGLRQILPRLRQRVPRNASAPRQVIIAGYGNWRGGHGVPGASLPD